MIKPISGADFNGELLFAKTKYYMLGLLTGAFVYGVSWSIHYWPAIHTTLTNPEAVMNVKVVTKYELKK